VSGKYKSLAMRNCKGEETNQVQETSNELQKSGELCQESVGSDEESVNGKW